MRQCDIPSWNTLLYTAQTQKLVRTTASKNVKQIAEKKAFTRDQIVKLSMERVTIILMCEENQLFCAENTTKLSY